VRIDVRRVLDVRPPRLRKRATLDLTATDAALNTKTLTKLLQIPKR
jgi:hypothetical protein